MLTFTLFASWIVITILAGIVSGGLGLFMSDFKEEGFTVAWVISTVILGVCMSYIMYSKGFIA